jgi:leucyl aminopeptidase
VAWRAETADEVRAIVEGTAYGAYDAGLFKEGYAQRPELTLALDAPAGLHGLAERQAVVVRHVDAARDLANRPPNDLTPEALAQHAHALARDHLEVETHGRSWIEERGLGAFAGVAAAARASRS